MQGQCQRWQAPTVWRQFLMSLQQTEWVVYAKPPLAGPQLVLRYLAAIRIAWPSPIDGSSPVTMAR